MMVSRRETEDLIGDLMGMFLHYDINTQIKQALDLGVEGKF